MSTATWWDHKVQPLARAAACDPVKPEGQEPYMLVRIPHHLNT